MSLAWRCLTPLALGWGIQASFGAGRRRFEVLAKEVLLLFCRKRLHGEDLKSMSIGLGSVGVLNGTTHKLYLYLLGPRSDKAFGCHYQKAHSSHPQAPGLQEGLVDKMVIGDIRVFCQPVFHRW